MKTFLITLALVTLASCSKPETENCTNEVVKVKQREDINGLIYTETMYKNTCTGETFIINTY